MHMTLGTVLVLVREEDSHKINFLNAQIFPIQSFYSTSVSSAVLSRRPQTRSVHGTNEQKQTGGRSLVKENTGSVKPLL